MFESFRIAAGRRLAVGVALALPLFGCGLVYDAVGGAFSYEPEELRERLSPGALRLVDEALRDLDARRRIDYHVHMVSSEVHPSWLSWWHSIRRARTMVYLSAPGRTTTTSWRAPQTSRHSACFSYGRRRGMGRPPTEVSTLDHSCRLNIARHSNTCESGELSMKRSDEVIKKGIVDELFWDERLDASRILVEANDGMVVLRGRTPSCCAKRIATNIAWKVGGARGVENLLEVTCTGDVPEDAELCARIENLLAWNAHIDAPRIIVSVAKRVVTLEGDVDSRRKCEHVEDMVSELSGVVAVENKLAVVPTKEFSDESIADQIVAAIDRHAALDVTDITVEVSNGAVTLDGTAPSVWAGQRATEIADRTAGVVKVTNDLRSGTTRGL